MRVGEGSLMKVFLMISLMTTFLLAGCTNWHAQSSSAAPTSGNSTISDVCTNNLSGNYLNPFIDSNSKKMVLYDPKSDKYTVTDWSATYSSIDGSRMIRFSDGSLLFAATAIGSSQEMLYRQYVDGTADLITPSSLFTSDVVISFGDFSGSQFLQVSCTKINISYDVSFQDGSSKIILFEYDTSTKVLKQIAVLQTILSAAECLDQNATADEKTALATDQAAADAAVTAYQAM